MPKALDQQRNPRSTNQPTGLIFGPLLAAYLATLPLYRWTLFSIGGKGVVPSDILFVALLTVATLRGAWRRPTRALWCVAMLPPSATLVVAVANRTPLSEAAPEIARTAYSMLTLAVLACLRIDEDTLRLAARTWIWASIVACAAGMAGYLAVVGFGMQPNLLARPNSPNLGPGTVRISGILHTNTLVLYLTLAASFATFQARFGTSERDRGLGTVALVVSSCTALASLSRGAAGFFAALALLAHGAELAPARLYRLRSAIGCLAAVLACSVLAVTLWAIVPVSVARPVNVDWNQRPSAYRVFHLAGLRMFKADPLFGAGPGRFGSRLGVHTNEKERLAAWPPVQLRPDTAPHSTWIGHAAEGGLTLLIAWGVVWCWVAAELWKTGAHGGICRYLGIALMALMTDGLFIDLAHLKFIWAASGLGLSARFLDPSTPGRG